MYNIVMSNKFQKDLKLILKRRYDLNLLEEIVDTLAKPADLPSKNKAHNLSGNYAGFKECHIASDWLLIYCVDDENNILHLFRTGTHSDLF